MPKRLPSGQPPLTFQFLAVLVLDADGMPYAELWRLLLHVERRLGRSRPSYSQVRRLAMATRLAKRRRKQELDVILSRTLSGLFLIRL